MKLEIFEGSFSPVSTTTFASKYAGELGLDDIPVAAGSMMLKDGGYKPDSSGYEFNVRY